MRPDATITTRTRRSERARILANGQQRIDQIADGALPFDLKIEAMFDVLLQVGFDLDRLARRRELSVLAGSVTS